MATSAVVHFAASGSTPPMIDTLFTRFQRWRPRPDTDPAPHAWTHEDSNWHGSSMDLARGLDITELAGTSCWGSDRPRPPLAFADTLPAVHDARR